MFWEHSLHPPNSKISSTVQVINIKEKMRKNEEEKERKP